MADAVMELPVRKQTLAELMDTVNELAEMAVSADEEELAVISDALVSARDRDVPQKIDGIAFFDRHAAAQIQLHNDMIGQMQASKRQWERKRDRIRDLTFAVLVSQNVDELKGNIFTAARRAGLDAPVVDDLGALPLEYCCVAPPKLSVDMEALHRDLASGREVPGAYIRSGAECLVIRPNARKPREKGGRIE